MLADAQVAPKAALWRTVAGRHHSRLRDLQADSISAAAPAHEGGHAPGPCSRHPGQDGGGYPAPRGCGLLSRPAALSAYVQEPVM